MAKGSAHEHVENQCPTCVGIGAMKERDRLATFLLSDDWGVIEMERDVYVPAIGISHLFEQYLKRPMPKDEP